MDPLHRFVAEPRARGVFSLLVSMDAPWCVDIADGAALTVMAVTKGSAWLVPARGAPPTHLTPGSVALVAHGIRYRVADAADRPPTVRIEQGQRCVTIDESVRSNTRHGLLTWGNSEDGRDQMAIGSYETQSLIGDHATGQLAEVTVVPADEINGPLLDLLARELADPGPGHRVVIDRLLDVLVCTAMRSAASATEPGWLSGTGDELVARALDLMHTAPEHPWTLHGLASRLHVSRATLAARFREEVGTPPGAYLTTWRLTLAADAVLSTSDGLESIARAVGYSSAFALSSAFKRHHGISPTEYRRRGRLPQVSDAAPIAP